MTGENESKLLQDAGRDDVRSQVPRVASNKPKAVTEPVSAVLCAAWIGDSVRDLIPSQVGSFAVAVDATSRLCLCRQGDFNACAQNSAET